MKKILISGTASGTGKTTITLAIEAALCRRGFVVQPFKCGPDYLDSAHHSIICGRKSRNLDTIMLSPAENLASLQRASRGADFIVAEGMMGLFDGLSGHSNLGSTAEIASTLQLPIVLVIDASHSARSIAATLLGFVTFDPHVRIAAVILNRVASESHYQMLVDAIQSTVSIPILGWVPTNSFFAIPERHLGLYDADERAWSETELTTLAEMAEEHLDLSLLMEIASTMELLHTFPPPIETVRPSVRIGIARDEAFSFYYEDNFDLLRDYGAELVEFSPLHDKCLPDNLDALYIGGGYPELHATTLSNNQLMIASVQQFCNSGRPVYAECGGMMYLANGIMHNGVLHSMTKVLSLDIEMSKRLVKFGYVKVRFNGDCILGPKQTEAVGHSFHYSKVNPNASIDKLYGLEYIRAGRFELEGYSVGNVLASYVHLHFRTNHQLPKHLISSALSSKTNL